MSTQSKSHAALAVEAVYAIANDPENWDLLLAALDNAPAPEPERQEELAELVAGSARLAEMAKAREVTPASEDVAAVLVSRSGRLLEANAAATPPVLTRMGFAQRTLNTTGLDALRDARRKLESANGPVIVKLDAGDGSDPCFAYALAPNDLSAALAGTLSARANDAGALALIIPAQAGLDRFWASLQESFGLTRAETRLTSLLKDGLSLKEAASELDLSVNTIRNQLASIFAKLGLNRQSDLVRSLTQLAALSGSVAVPNLASDVREMPPPPLRYLRLADGRNLAWREYGLSDGQPAMLFHPGLGASLLVSGSDALCKRRRLRLIVPERPGMGHSDPDPQHSYQSVARDVEALVVHLGIESFPVVALTSGVRFALAAAIALKNRVSRILVVSARVPPEPDKPEDGVTSPMVLFNRRVTANLWLLEPVFAIMRTRLSRPLIARIMRSSATGPGDAAYIEEHPELIDVMVASLRESMAVSARGTTDEMKCERRSRDPDLTPLTAPITIWHGAEDTYGTTDEVATYLEGKIADRRTIPNIGNYLIHQRWPEILTWLASGNRAAA